MPDADTSLHVREGLSFNERPKKSRWWLVGHAAHGLIVWLSLMVTFRLVDGHFDHWFAFALLPVALSSILQYWVSHGFPKVATERDGLRVRGRLVSFDQIRSIKAQKNGTDYAVITFGVYGADGQVTLLAPQDCSPPEFRQLLAELAAKAGVELDLVRDGPAKKTRLPKQARMAKA
jgi:hypothetical protein